MKFGGKRYAFASRHHSKREAQHRADSYRRDGYSARVRRNSLGWYEVLV